MNQIVGAQLYTIREQVKTVDDFITSMEKLKKIGFEYIQFSGVTAPLEPKQVKEILDRYGLKIACSHMPWERLYQEPEKVAEENLEMGCPIVGLSWYPENRLDTKENSVEYIKRLQKIGKSLKQNGVQFVLHNHWMEFHRYDGKAVLDHIFDETDPEEVQFILCCYWAQFAGADPIDYIYKYKGRIPCVHYKDMIVLGVEDKATFAPIGQGNMNYKAIWKACEETGVQYAMIEQDQCLTDPFDCLAMSREYMLSLGEAYDREKE